MPKRITKVTTKKGDDGSTSMGDGSRVSKTDPLIIAIGEIDELNSWIGLLSSLIELRKEKFFLIEVQNNLFDLGGILTTKSSASLKKININKLENETKKFNSVLPELENFVLPTGSKESSFIHISRAVCRRAERSLVKVAKTEPVDSSCIIYLNRLSDFLFVLARKTNQDLGIKELLWSQE